MDENEMPEEVRDSPHFAQLRKRAEAAEADAAAWKSKAGEYRGLLVTNAVELAGFKPGEDGAFTGVAGLLVKEFQASLGDDALPSKDTFTALAEQYGVKPETAPAAASTPSAAAELQRLQAPGDALRQAATIPEPSGDLVSQIAEAEKSGDIGRSISLKQQMAYAPASA